MATYKVREVRIGKYSVKGHASKKPDGSWVGTANLTWEDGNATAEQARHYDKPFATEDEAIHHALEQIELRVKNGDL